VLYSRRQYSKYVPHFETYNILALKPSDIQTTFEAETPTTRDWNGTSGPASKDYPIEPQLDDCVVALTL
jgi:hypothetical protein